MIIKLNKALRGASNAKRSTSGASRATGVPSMTCSFCGSRNNEGEHRCGKCGRRPGDTLNGEFILAHTEGALAAKFAPVRGLRPRTRAEPQGHGPWSAGCSNRCSRTGNRTSSTLRNTRLQRARIETPPASKAAKSKTAKPPPRLPGGTGLLDFLPPEPPTPHTSHHNRGSRGRLRLPGGDEAASRRGCSDRLEHGADWIRNLSHSLLRAGRRIHLESPQPDSVRRRAVADRILLRLSWTLVGADSSGMRLSGLRLTTFEGFPLERKHRVDALRRSCPEPLHCGGALVEPGG